MVLARVLPDEASYGTLCQLIMLYMVLSQIFAIGLPQSTYYFLPRYADGARRGFLTQLIVLLTISGTLMGLGFYIGADMIGHALNSPQLPPLLRLFAIYPVLMLPTLAVEGTLLYAKRPIATVLFNATVRCGMFFALVIPAWHHAPMTHMVATWMVFAIAMWGLALFLMLSTVWHLPFAWERSMLRDEWGFSAPLALGAILSLAAAYLDRFYASHAFGAKAFGVYSNATMEIPTVTMVTNAVSIVLMAEFSRRTAQGEFAAVMPIWHGAILKCAAFIFASLGFLAFWGTDTMRLFFSDRFIDSGVIFSIYVWIIPLRMLALQPLFISLGATRAVIAILVIGFIIEFCLIMGFGHLFGLTGMAVGVLLANYAVATLATHWFVRWTTKIGWKAFLPWRKLGIAMLVTVGAGAISWLIHLLPQPMFPLILLYAIGLVVFLLMYGLGLYATGLLPAEVMARLSASKQKLEQQEVTV
ncbi:MAG: lipopolysaccharide biosynthesis protein [Armatimonadota bacterium]